MEINKDEYLVQYTTDGALTTTSVKKDELITINGKVYKDNLLYSETYSPNRYAFSRDSEKCCFDAPQKF